jgi:polysaccharide pyruvyl transferase WcaK-like protein
VHILVEPSDYVLRNAGDMAMQEVAITRLARLWPAAAIFVLTDTPDQLPTYASGVRPLDASGRRAWLTGVSSMLPITRVRGLWRERHNRRKARDFVRLVRSASLVLVSGMGGITDVFHDYATGVLKTLELAIGAGVPTALMGQGLGPLGDGRLRRLAASILPRVDLVALREARAGHPLLIELGVAGTRIVTTGDDAIESAHPRDAIALGTALGVNLRCASYSEVDADLADRVKDGITESARRHGAVLVPVPISRVPGEEDALTIARLLGGRAPDVSPVPPALPALLEQVRRCRVVVTGSYHAGVFALASGIPVVALARSTYYVDKFLGLADQFGGGCELVSLAEPDIAGRLVAAVDRAWRDAERVRPRLLEAAAHQIQLGHAAYRRVYDLVERWGLRSV